MDLLKDKGGDIMTLANIGIVLVFMTFAIGLLPESPFTIFIESLNTIPYLDIFNWFFPVSEILAIGQAWLVAITAFYTVSLILRWIRAIE